MDENTTTESQPGPIQVLKSNAGYYIGTLLDGMPYSRNSVEYWPLKSQADEALATGNWTRREYD